MTRTLAACLLAASLGLGLVGCNKPEEEDCRKAIENMQSLLGTEDPNTDVNAQIRRCRGGSSKKAVACAVAAKTIEELRACEFMSKSKTDGSAAETK